MSSTTPSRHARHAFPAALLSLVLLTAACGSSGNDTAVTSDKPAAASLFGPEKVASGAPVKIGYITTGRTQAIDVTAEVDAAKAVVAYANKHLGGLGGKPVELVVCEEKGTPAGGQACGNQFVQDQVVAVTGAGPSFVDSTLKVVQPAGIPAALHRAATQFTLSTPGIFIFSNPVSVFGTPAGFAKEKGFKTSALILIDVPGVTGPANSLGAAFYKNAGAAASVVAIPPGTADMTPQIQAAANKKPDMYQVLGDPNFCASALRAIKTLGITAPVVAADNCLSPDSAKSVPGGFEGTTVSVQSVLDPNTDDYKLFAAVAKEFGKGVKVDTLSATGYQAMLAFIQAAGSNGNTDVTKEGITKALTAMPALKYPLSGGATFQCNGTALKGIAPNVCSIYGVLADGTKTDELKNFRPAQTDGIYKLG